MIFQEILESANFHLHLSNTRDAVKRAEISAREAEGTPEHGRAEKVHKTIKTHYDKLNSENGPTYYREYMRKKGAGNMNKTSVPSIK